MCHFSKIRNRVVLTYVVIYRNARDREAPGRGRPAGGHALEYSKSLRFTFKIRCIKHTPVTLRPLFLTQY